VSDGEGAYVDFRPFHDWVVIEPDQITQSQGGIFLPAGAEDDPEFMSRCGKAIATRRLSTSYYRNHFLACAFCQPQRLALF
jgi:hypothetical protein